MGHRRHTWSKRMTLGIVRRLGRAMARIRPTRLPERWVGRDPTRRRLTRSPAPADPRSRSAGVGAGTPTTGPARDVRADPDRPYDAIVIGAGICGLVFLAYARERGLRVLALDAQDTVGGLWSRLPAWQDIQNRAADFSLNGVPLRGVHQPDVARFAGDWVRRFDLADCLRLGCAVTSVTPCDGGWRVVTDHGELASTFLVVATGAQNVPRVPTVERSAPDLVELHSSQLQRPEDLGGRVVTVVGGGASAWDLLDLAVEHGAARIHWVLRGSRWFLPTRRPKALAWPNLRELAVVQSVLRSPALVSAFCQGMLRAEYDHFELAEIEPDEPFDIERDQLVPGRAAMMETLDDIRIHHGHVDALCGGEVVLSDGDAVETDVLLWATGYRTDLDHLGLRAFEGVQSPTDLRPRLGSLVRSIDHPDLFFVGTTLLDSTTATPLMAAIESRSIVAHLEGRTEIPLEPQPALVAYWDLFRHFARFDHANYRRGWWPVKYLLLACWWAIARNRSIRV